MGKTPEPERASVPDEDIPDFMPKVGDKLNVQLPSELIRSTVHKVIDVDTVIVVLDLATPIQKTHSYQHGDLVPAVRKEMVLGEIWEAVPERLLDVIREENRQRKAEAQKRAEEARKSDMTPRSQSLKKKA